MRGSHKAQRKDRYLLSPPNRSLVKWILHIATNDEVGVWFSQDLPNCRGSSVVEQCLDKALVKSSILFLGTKNMEDDAAALVRRLALKTRFSEMGWGSTPPSSAKLWWCSTAVVHLLHTEQVVGSNPTITTIPDWWNEYHTLLRTKSWEFDSLIGCQD